MYFNDKEIYFILYEENYPWLYANRIAEILEYNEPRINISRHITE